MALVHWPHSDTRLDTAQGYELDRDPARFANLANIPMLMAFGVRDQGSIEAGPKLHYRWNRDCTGTLEQSLDQGQIDYINGYNPGFFHQKAIDSQEQYRRYLRFLHAALPSLVVGSYLSATSCLDGATNPYVEHYYPEGALNYYDFGNGDPSRMGTSPYLAGCALHPARWLLNVADADLAARFRRAAFGIISRTVPRPPFVFLDNVLYELPEFVWFKDQTQVDCRDVGTENQASCDLYREGLRLEFGQVLFQQQFLTHYAELVGGLEALGVRSILNVTAPPAVFGYPKERSKFAAQLSDVIAGNGLAFENPFGVGTRSAVADVQGEIDVHRSFLSGGKLVIFFAKYGAPAVAESSWFAAMAMLIRDQGDALFVSRSLEHPPLDWAQWPRTYGSGLAPAVFQQIGTHRADVGDTWRLQRDFAYGHVTGCHIDIKQGETFDLATVVPPLAAGTYSTVHGPALGHLAGLTYEGLAEGVDYFTLGADQDTNGRWRQLVTASVQVWHP
jgi:hypothetical protein